MASNHQKEAPLKAMEEKEKAMEEAKDEVKAIKVAEVDEVVVDEETRNLKESKTVTRCRRIRKPRPKQKLRARPRRETSNGLQALINFGPSRKKFNPCPMT